MQLNIILKIKRKKKQYLTSITLWKNSQFVFFGSPFKFPSNIDIVILRWQYHYKTYEVNLQANMLPRNGLFSFVKTFLPCEKLTFPPLYGNENGGFYDNVWFSKIQHSQKSFLSLNQTLGKYNSHVTFPTILKKFCKTKISRMVNLNDKKRLYLSLPYRFNFSKNYFERKILNIPNH